MALAAIAVLEPFEAHVVSQPDIPMEESILECQPDGETATFAVSAGATQASDAALPQHDALNLSQGEESADQRSFVVQWQGTIDQRRASIASPVTTGLRRSWSLESADLEHADTADSPTQ